MALTGSPRSATCAIVVLSSLAAAFAACSPATPSPQLRVTSIQPVSGSTFGGTAVTISGSGFSAGATVAIGGAPALNVAVVSDGTITATTAQRAAGVADVVISVAGRTASLPAAFTYLTPSGGANIAPTIENLLVRGSRPNQPPAMADLNEALSVSAVVSDVETAPASMKYEWSATGGTFEGSGPEVTWRAPASAPATPVDVTITVTVVETYVSPNEQGLPVTLEHRVSRAVVVRVHNSVKEISDLARDFLTLFSQSIIPPAQVVAGFADRCPGKQEELEDTVRQRCLVTVNSFTIGAPDTRVNFGGTCAIGGATLMADACAVFPVRWEVTVNANPQQCPGYDGTPPGTKQVSEGPDLVTAVYDNRQWRLCDSRWGGTTTPLWRRARSVR